MKDPNTVLAQIGETPLVALRSIGEGLAVPLLAKCEHLNPGGSVKDRVALAIINDAEKQGVLPPGGTIIEATAGNTGVGLALVAAVRGYSLVCVLPEKMSEDKRTCLRAMGAKVIVTPNAPPQSEQNFQKVARRMAKDHGWFLADQFRNPANLRVHEETTGPEILRQIDPKGARMGPIGAFVAGAGTGGTISGVGRALKARHASVRVVLADPLGSGLAEWVETGAVGEGGDYAIEGIGSSDPPANLHHDVIDEVVRVSDEESFAMVGRLVREEGLLVGGSAGTAVAAALLLARSTTVDGAIVVLLPDSWDRYRGTAWMQALGRAECAS